MELLQGSVNLKSYDTRVKEDFIWLHVGIFEIADDESLLNILQHKSVNEKLNMLSWQLLLKYT